MRMTRNVMHETFLPLTFAETAYANPSKTEYSHAESQI
jgi:hypothetical protein